MQKVAGLLDFVKQLKISKPLRKCKLDLLQISASYYKTICVQGRWTLTVARVSPTMHKSLKPINTITNLHIFRQFMNFQLGVDSNHGVTAGGVPNLLQAKQL